MSCMWCICTQNLLDWALSESLFLLFFSFDLWKQCFIIWRPPDRWSHTRKVLITRGWGHQGHPSSVCVPENNVEKPSSLAWNNCPSPVSVSSESLVEGSSKTKSMPVQLLDPVFPCTCWRNSKVLAHSIFKHFSCCSTFLSFSFLTKYTYLCTFLFKIIF